MTLIMDMTTGEEYPGEEMSCPRAAFSTPTRADKSQEPSQRIELQLAMVEVTPHQQSHSFDMAGMDINELLDSIDD